MSAMFDFITGKKRGKIAELEASLEHTSGYLGVEIEDNAKLRTENERLRTLLSDAYSKIIDLTAQANTDFDTARKDHVVPPFKCTELAKTNREAREALARVHR